MRLAARCGAVLPAPGRASTAADARRGRRPPDSGGADATGKRSGGRGLDGRSAARRRGLRSSRSLRRSTALPSPWSASSASSTSLAGWRERADLPMSCPAVSLRIVAGRRRRGRRSLVSLAMVPSGNSTAEFADPDQRRGSDPGQGRRRSPGRISSWSPSAAGSRGSGRGSAGSSSPSPRASMLVFLRRTRGERLRRPFGRRSPPAHAQLAWYRPVGIPAHGVRAGPSVDGGRDGSRRTGRPAPTADLPAATTPGSGAG